MKIVIVTPEKTLLDEPAASIVVPLFDGEMGILPGHARMIGRLGFGELRFSNSGAPQRYYVDGGFVQVAGDEVNVLTGRAVPVKDLQRADIEKQLADAEKLSAENPEQQEAKSRAIAQAKAQLHVLDKA